MMTESGAGVLGLILGSNQLAVQSTLRADIMENQNNR